MPPNNGLPQIIDYVIFKLWHHLDTGLVATNVSFKTMSDTIFHSGEEYIQQQCGERGLAMRNQGIINNELTPGSASFIRNQKIVFASSMDVDGNLWTSVLAGKTGFMETAGSRYLTINTPFMESDPEDLFWQNIGRSPGIGLLFIDFLNRRRLRINGCLSADAKLWKMEIKQVYPNCPKYIQRREFITDYDEVPLSAPDLQNWVKKADTIFVGSTDGRGNLDVSHRGGETGFIKYVNKTTLRVPDYVGNSMFNTLGNFHINPAAGMLFLDFNNGNTLQLSGKAVLHLNEASTDVYTGGTKRFWDFIIEKTESHNSLPGFSSNFLDFSPYNP